MSLAICDQSSFDAYLNDFRNRRTVQAWTTVFSRTAVTATGMPLSTVTREHEHVPDAAVLNLAQDTEPELSALAVAVLPAIGPGCRASRPR